jgi:hypothetical protein
MPIKKNGKFEFSHEETVQARRELSSFLMKYVNSEKVSNISEIKKSIFDFTKSLFKVDFGQENVWVMRADSRDSIECGVFLWPYKIELIIVPRKEEEKKNESKSKV